MKHNMEEVISLLTIIEESLGYNPMSEQGLLCHQRTLSFSAPKISVDNPPA